MTGMNGTTAPSPSLGKTLYVGTFIHSIALTELEICENGVIGVDERGKIAFIDREGNGQRVGWEAAKIVRIAEQGKGVGFFFPGFIDTHIHASQFPNAGIFGKSTLLDWLNTYTFPLESSFKDISIARRIYSRVVSRTLSHGTTTACYYATIHVPATNVLADICKARGQRAFVGRVCMNDLAPDYYRDESVEAGLEATKQCIDHVKSIDPDFDLISPILTPRFAPSCTQASLEGLGVIHQETGIPVQTHISENKAEINLVAAKFPGSKSYADVYDSAGLLTPKTILAHAVHLSPDERALVKQREAKVSHCPASNTALTSGCCPVRQLLKEGITVGLGTDVSGGYTSSMLAECREALGVSRHLAMDGEPEVKLSVEEALYLATRGSAKVVGLEEKIGGFEVGMDWDAQMVKLGTVGVEGELDGVCDGEGDDGLVEVFGGESWEDRVAKWVYTGDDRNTRAVWVKGRLVHSRDGMKV